MTSVWMWLIGIAVASTGSILIPCIVGLAAAFSRLSLHEYRISQVEDTTKDLADTVHTLSDTSIRTENKIDILLHSMGIHHFEGDEQKVIGVK